MNYSPHLDQTEMPVYSELYATDRNATIFPDSYVSDRTVAVSETKYDASQIVSENRYLREDIYNLQTTLNRVFAELKSERSLRSVSDQQLRHALSLLRDSVSNALSLCICPFAFTMIAIFFICNLHARRRLGLNFKTLARVQFLAQQRKQRKMNCSFQN